MARYRSTMKNTLDKKTKAQILKDNPDKSPKEDCYKGFRDKNGRLIKGHTGRPRSYVNMLALIYKIDDKAFHKVAEHIVERINDGDKKLIEALAMKLLDKSPNHFAIPALGHDLSTIRGSTKFLEDVIKAAIEEDYDPQVIYTMITQHMANIRQGKAEEVMDMLKGNKK